MFKWFLNPKTGKTVHYPEHFAELKPYLVPVDENPICEDCQLDTRDQEKAPEQVEKGEKPKGKNE